MRGGTWLYFVAAMCLESIPGSHLSTNISKVMYASFMRVIRFLKILFFMRLIEFLKKKYLVGLSPVEGERNRM